MPDGRVEHRDVLAEVFGQGGRSVRPDTSRAGVDVEQHRTQHPQVRVPGGADSCVPTALENERPTKLLDGDTPADPRPHCIYLAQPREARLAEFYRRTEGQARGVQSLLPQSLHTIEVTDLVAVDLTTEQALEAVGVRMADIEAPDRTHGQQVGHAANFLGMQGIHAPSATSMGFVIAAFERQLHPGQLRVVASEQLEIG